MALRGSTNEQITKWTLEAESWHSNLKKLDASLNKNQKSLGATIVKSQLFVKALGKAKDVIFDLASQTAEYSRVVVNFKGDLESATKATGGLVSALELMKAQNRLNILGVKLSNEEYANMLAGVKKLSFAMGVDMKTGLDSFVTGVARGSALMLDNIGILVKSNEAYKKYALSIGKTVKELTEAEKKVAFQKEAMYQLTIKAGELDEVNETLTDGITRQTNAIKNWIASMLDAANRAVSLKDVLMWGPSAQMHATGKREAVGTKENIDALNKIFGTSNSVKKELAEINRSNQETLNYIVQRQEAIDRKLYGEHGGTGYSKGKALFGIYGELHGQKKKKKKSSRGIKGQAGIDYTPSSFTADASNIEAIAEKIREAEVMPVLNQMLAENTAMTEKNARARAFQAQQDRIQIRGMELNIERHKEFSETIKQANEDVKNMAVEGLAGLASGMWQAADAALIGGESFATAMAKMVKSTLLGVAQQATVLGMMQLAKYVASWFTDLAALKASGIYFATAAVAGGAGLAMSAAGVGKSAEDIKPEREKGSTFKQSFGRRIEDNKQPIYINVYLGEPNNPQSALMMTKQLQAQLGAPPPTAYR